MPYSGHHHNLLLVVHDVHDSVVAHPNAPGVVHVGEFFAAGRSGFIGQRIDLFGDPWLVGPRDPFELAESGRLKLDRICHVIMLQDSATEFRYRKIPEIRTGVRVASLLWRGNMKSSAS